MKRIVIASALLGLLAAAVPAFAHHSFAAEYDGNKPVTITGVLKSVDWRNPHIYYLVDVKDAATGKLETWTLEGYPPNMIGRFNPNYLMGFTGSTWQNLPEFNPKLVSEYAVKVYGSGHVVAYNAISNFHDGVDVATYGNPDGSPDAIRERMPVSIDFYGNDISNMEDNCIEADGGAHNIRIFRNRCFNMSSSGTVAQTSAISRWKSLWKIPRPSPNRILSSAASFCCRTGKFTNTSVTSSTSIRITS